MALHARDLIVEGGEPLPLLCVPVLPHLEQALLGLLLPQAGQLLVAAQQLLAAVRVGKEKN
jgi:hypothetical protein